MSRSLHIVGDVHLRRMQGAFFAWLDWLAQQPPGDLVLLGDIVEYWVETPYMAQSVRPLRAALGTLRARGWTTLVIPGNREMAAGRLLQLGLGTRVVWPGVQLSSGTKRVYIEHGDRACKDPGHRLLVSFIRGFWWRATTMLLPQCVHDAVAHFMRRKSKGSQAPEDWRGPRVDFDPRELAGRRRFADILVAGHIHKCRDWQLGCLRAVLVGDWRVDGGTWIELVDGDVNRRVFSVS